MPKIKIDQADKYFSLYIRTKAGWRCERCFKQYTPPTSALHCSHFYGRGKEATRFEPLNATSLCYGCHQYLGSHPAEHYAFQLNRLGQETMDKLQLASNTTKKKNERKLEAAYWKQQLDKLV